MSIHCKLKMVFLRRRQQNFEDSEFNLMRFSSTPSVWMKFSGRFAAKSYKQLGRFLGTPSVWTENFLAASRPNHTNSWVDFWGPQVFERPLRGQVIQTVGVDSGDPKCLDLPGSQIATFIFSVLNSWDRLGSKQRGGSITWGRVDHLDPSWFIHQELKVL